MSRLAFQAGRTIQMQNSCSNEGKLLPPPRRRRSNLLLGVCLVRKWCHLGGHLFGFDQALHNNSSRVSHSEGNSMLLKPCIVLMFFRQDAWERDWCLHDYWESLLHVIDSLWGGFTWIKNTSTLCVHSKR